MISQQIPGVLPASPVDDDQLLPDSLPLVCVLLVGQMWMIMMMMIVMMTMMTACRHIPTMTKSHHGGEMSIIIKVGMCQCQIPTIHGKLQLQQLALVSGSTRPQC